MLRGLPPVADHRSRVLILGTFPSELSLAAQQYYANPRNQFWSITAAIFGFDRQEPYESRIAALQAHGIALWDVVHQCRRKGSLDSNIDPKGLVANDFHTFFGEHPAIRRVYFAIAKAESIYSRHASVEPRIDYHRLPSTSTANARMSLADKLDAWRMIGG
jgi:hypoxanthine-DNA glycosylase